MDQESHDVEQAPAQHYQPVSQQPTRAQRRKRTHRKWLVIGIIALLLLAAAGGGYWFVELRDKPAAAPAASSADDTAASQDTSKQLITERATDTAPAGTTTYTSSQQNLNLSFSYPTSWTVSPKQTTASATTPITVTSPSSTVTAADGSLVSGKVVVTIRPGGGQISELVSATAAQDSRQIAYAKPTASQRQYPFLTFIHLAAASKTAEAFEEVMITGGQQFKKSDVISSDNLGTIDPLITAAFYQCKTTECPLSGAPNLSLNDFTWQNAPLLLQAGNILTSFKLN